MAVGELIAHRHGAFLVTPPGPIDPEELGPWSGDLRLGKHPS